MKITNAGKLVIKFLEKVALKKNLRYHNQLKVRALIQR